MGSPFDTLCVYNVFPCDAYRRDGGLAALLRVIGGSHWTEAPEAVQ